MILKAFGCSFIDGTDLENPAHVWPAIVAHELGYRFKNCAFGGTGNKRILAQILSELGEDDNKDPLYFIQWTWVDRFDYVTEDNIWQTCRPSLDTDHADYYFRNLHNSYKDTFESLIAVYTAIEILNSYNVPYRMSGIDSLLWESCNQEFFHPASVEIIQTKIESKFQYFDGLDFLSWSRRNNFKESRLWHPLEEAHSAAAQYVLTHWF